MLNHWPVLHFVLSRFNFSCLSWSSVFCYSNMQRDSVNGTNHRTCKPYVLFMHTNGYLLKESWIRLFHWWFGVCMHVQEAWLFHCIVEVHYITQFFQGRGSTRTKLPKNEHLCPKAWMWNKRQKSLSAFFFINTYILNSDVCLIQTEDRSMPLLHVI